MKRLLAYIILIFLSFPLLLTAQETGGNDPAQTTASVQLSDKNQVELFPNPVTTYLYVEIYNPDMIKPSFELRNIIGNEFQIEVQEMAPFKYRIPMENLAQGYYFLVVQDETTRFKQAFKFLKR